MRKGGDPGDLTDVGLDKSTKDFAVRPRQKLLSRFLPEGFGAAAKPLIKCAACNLKLFNLKHLRI